MSPMGQVKVKKVEFLELPDGSIYEGEVKDGKPHGQGILLSEKGDWIHYEGDFLEGLPNGLGIATRSDGAVYEGEFRKGVRHGKGVTNFTSGNRYEGEYGQDITHGYGKFTSRMAIIMRDVFCMAGITAREGKCGSMGNSRANLNMTSVMVKGF